MNAAPPAPEPEPRPLPVLRAMIDAVDREVLHMLARRDSLVAEVAAFKRRNRVGIRDPRREREILDDRCARAERLGLSPQVVESVFRLVLWGSRDRQAALRAEVPADLEPRTVAIVGGLGAMGGCLARLFGDLGHTVVVADLETPLRPEDAAATADVVIISVPIDETVGVIRRLGPLVRPEALLADVTSVKTGPLDAMLEATARSGASVVGTHPLFGPSVHSMQGQRVVITPGRGETWQRWLEDMFRARGLIVTQAGADQHDQAMAVVQVLTHFATEVMGRTLAAAGVSIEQTLEYTSPVYLMELLMTARHFAQSPELYASIQMSNPRRAEITAAFVEAARRHKQAIDTGDREAVHEAFDVVRGFLGPFTEQALEQSSFLIDRLVERG